jgi:hypothetical protein
VMKTQLLIDGKDVPATGGATFERYLEYQF